MTTENKPMSGWRRLWVVASTILGVPVLIAAYQPYSHYEYFTDVGEHEIRYRASDAIRGPMGCDRGEGSWTSTLSYPQRKAFRLVENRPPYIGQSSSSYAAESPPKELRGKVVEQWLYNVSVTCPGTTPQWWWWMAILPALFMAVVGLTCRWIYRGFRPVSPRDE